MLFLVVWVRWLWECMDRFKRADFLFWDRLKLIAMMGDIECERIFRLDSKVCESGRIRWGIIGGCLRKGTVVKSGFSKETSVKWLWRGGIQFRLLLAEVESTIHITWASEFLEIVINHFNDLLLLSVLSLFDLHQLDHLTSAQLGIDHTRMAVYTSIWIKITSDMCTVSPQNIILIAIRILMVILRSNLRVSK